MHKPAFRKQASPPLPSRRWLRISLRVVQVALLVALAGYAVLGHMVQARRGARVSDALRLANTEPLMGSALKLTVNRVRSGSRCKAGFGMASDDYFERYDGDFCSRFVWRAPGTTPLHEVEIVSKVFFSEQQCEEYTWRFRGLYLHGEIPSHLLLDVSASVPVVGTDVKAYIYDPALMVFPLSGRPAHQFKHLIYIFRVHHVFVKLHVSGSAPISGDYIKGLAQKIEKRILTRLPTPASRQAFRSLQQLNLAVGLHGAQRALARLCNETQASTQRLLAASLEMMDTLLGQARHFVAAESGRLMANFSAALWPNAAVVADPAALNASSNTTTAGASSPLPPIFRLPIVMNVPATFGRELENILLAVVAIVLFLLAEGLSLSKPRPAAAAAVTAAKSPMAAAEAAAAAESTKTALKKASRAARPAP